MDAIARMTPGRGKPQHLEALSRANQVRLARAELKRRVADGEVEAGEVILECPWEARSMAVVDLLMSQRRWGTTRCRRLLAEVPVPETKAIGQMTERQRRALADMLRSGRIESPYAGALAAV